MDGPCRGEVHSVPAPDGMAGFRVVDNGIGIPIEHRAKGFDLFSRLHTDEEYTGTGLGLSLCQRIVAQHEGTITVSNGVNGGIAFTVILKEG